MTLFGPKASVTVTANSGWVCIGVAKTSTESFNMQGLTPPQARAVAAALIDSANFYDKKGK